MAMEEGVLASATTGALESVVRKLATLLREEHSLLDGTRAKIVLLEAELQRVRAFLVELSSRVQDPDEEDRRWMKEARELSYDVEDSLDDFMLRADDGEPSKPKGVKGFVKRSTALLTEAKNRHQISDEIRSHETVAEETAEWRVRRRIDGSICKASNATVDPRVFVLYKEMSELAIDGPADEVIKLLNRGEEDDASVQQLRVVSIVGCAGLGKTTLARRVYDTFGKQFQYRAFVSVSRNPDAVMILRTIHNQLGYDKTVPGDAQRLIDSISNFLQDKRYFIVVDGVWDDQTWEIIKCAFSRSSCGSRIITTTRINEVAKSCSTSYGGCVHKLSPLSIVDSERLFLRRVFGSEEQCPPHLKKVADEILQKSGGLPLAIITISGLLATNTQEDQWEQVKNCIGHGLGSNPAVEKMTRILSSSYFHLPPYLQSCLLYLSIFPEDYEIQKESLVMRWIAEGFIPEEHGHIPYELGEKCFIDLINRSLIQPGVITMFDEVETCRVQGTILDFIISKSKEENFVSLLSVPGVNPEAQNKVRRLSLQNGSEIPADLAFSNARSLTVFGNHVKISSLLKFRHLRVLDFDDCRLLEDHHLAVIGNLVHLKYLRLQYAVITKLPEQIAELQYLQTFDIRGANTIIEIPSAICRLQRLVRLVVDDGTILPDEIGCIRALQVLEGINVYSQSTNFVQQVGQLSNLRKLGIEFTNSYAGDNWEENVKEMVSSICKLGKANLHSLCISISEGAEQIFEESWCPAPRSLRELVIEVDVVSRVPRWMGTLVNLQKLHLSMWEAGEEDLVILGGLPNLRYLCLPALTAGSKEQRLRISQSHGFPSLSHFQIGTEECALRLFFEAGSMPKLQKLELNFDAEETDSMTNGDFDFGIEHLSCLTSIHCDESIRPAVEAAMERAIEGHPNHPTLVWR